MAWDWLLTEASGDAQRYLETARVLRSEGALRLAATAYDGAYGLSPLDTAIRTERQAVLDQLAVVEHGLTFRYIPAGTFLMGSQDGEADERPVHRVQLDEFWLSDTPISWTAYCELMGYEAPPSGLPFDYWKRNRHYAMENVLSGLVISHHVRVSYCENETLEALDWHSHMPHLQYTDMKGNPIPNPHPAPPREHPDSPYRYELKPMVSVHWGETQMLCKRLTTPAVQYRLPSEAQWEKAARGGLVQQPYAWGSELPDRNRCDFNRFHTFAIAPMRRFPPNGYGLYAVCGGVWEWTQDWYDASYYSHSPLNNPTGSKKGQHKVWRGGSWSDSPESVTVSFRMASPNNVRHWQDGYFPNLGFRLCRVERKR